MTSVQTLQTFFGYQDFRPGQIEIINTIIQGRDSLSLLQTGGGKSICFQVPSLMLGGTTLVVSPLVSLMKDQVDHLKQRNICSTFLHSGLSKPQLHTEHERIARGDYTFVYVAPERLLSRDFLKSCQKIFIPLLVVDEAHCISEWGHDFRPAYVEIPQFISALPRHPTIAAFTATATTTTVHDIVTQLQLRSPIIHAQPLSRNNLIVRIYNCPKSTWQELVLLRLLIKHRGESGIIYAATREQTEKLVSLIDHYRKLMPSLPPIAAYHGALTSAKRADIQNKFIHNEIPLIAATNAFGMGIDKPDIRFVIHFHIPASLEAYYQEIGRAGRDGEKGHCYLLHNNHNLNIHVSLIKNGVSRSKDEASHKLDKLQLMHDYVVSSRCRTAFVASYFNADLEHTNHAAHFAQNAQCPCDNCLNRPPPHPLLQALTCHQEKERLATILRWSITMAQKHNCSPSQIITQLQACFLALCCPLTNKHALLIPGIGSGWVERWWHDYNQLRVTIPA